MGNRGRSVPWDGIAAGQIDMGEVGAHVDTLSLKSHAVSIELTRRFRWLRLPGRMLWLTGLGSLLYSTILLAPRQITLVLLISTFALGVPLLLILATLYVFRAPSSSISPQR